MLNFKYRYVPFGIRFSELHEESRSCAASQDQPVAALFRNEVVTDVGGVCWGFHGETRPIFDHHFVRPGQFPSAAAAVLHNARRLADLRDRLLTANGNGAGDSEPLDFWLATHREPDFDALSSLYLVRAILSGEIPADGWDDYGLHPDGWLTIQRDQPRKIDWFGKQVSGLPPDRRWPILLAGYAASVDNCRRLACPKNRSLHSILYAALRRGRDYLRESDPAGKSADQPAPCLAGAREFFDEVRSRLSDPQAALNPWCDSVLESSTMFAPELAMLDRELHAYERDIQRARQTIVFVQQAAEEFDAWYPQVQRLPLLSANSHAKPAPKAVHLHPPTGDAARQAYRQLDGLYLRDPECLLFKEWARSDTEHSTLGQGFLLTAIAYSNDRESQRNHSNYFFSLDPEFAQAQRLHLYNVWAQLQAGEAAAWQTAAPPSPPGKAHECREGYEDRAAARPDSFRDPWFDGANYGCTIIATPNGGTLLPEGVAADLADDPVAGIVQRELEHSVFEPTIHLEELSFKPVLADRPPLEHPLFDAEPLPTREHYWRFGHVRLKRDVELASGPMAKQIGRTLWRQLEPQFGDVLPSDFLQRHLLWGSDWVGVWSRQGILVAWLPGSPQRVTQFLEPLRTLAALAREIEAYCRPWNPQHAEEFGERLTIGEDLSRRVADYRRELALLDHRLLDRFFHALNMHAVLEAVHEIHRSMADRAMNERQIEISAGMDQAMKQSAAIQARLNWLQILVVGAYVVAFLNLLVASFPSDVHDKEIGFRRWSPLIVLVMSLVTALVAYFYLSSARRSTEHSDRRSRITNLVFALFVLSLPVLFYAFGTWRQWIWHQRHSQTNDGKPAAATGEQHPSASRASANPP